MNNEHPEDNDLIARAFGSPGAEDAAMTAVDDLAGTWTYILDGALTEVRIPWTGPISERPEIRREIVVIYDAACALLGVTPRPHE